MESKVKFLLSFIMILLLNSFLQRNCNDLESALNSYTTVDVNRDYNQDGVTKSNHHEIPLKVPVIVYFERYQLEIEVNLRPIILGAFAYISLIQLADFVPFIFRPPPTA